MSMGEGFTGNFWSTKETGKSFTNIHGRKQDRKKDGTFGRDTADEGLTGKHVDYIDTDLTSADGYKIGSIKFKLDSSGISGSANFGAHKLGSKTLAELGKSIDITPVIEALKTLNIHSTEVIVNLEGPGAGVSFNLGKDGVGAQASLQAAAIGFSIETDEHVLQFKLKAGIGAGRSMYFGESAAGKPYQENKRTFTCGPWEMTHTEKLSHSEGSGRAAASEIVRRMNTSPLVRQIIQARRREMGLPDTSFVMPDFFGESKSGSVVDMGTLGTDIGAGGGGGALTVGSGTSSSAARTGKAVDAGATRAVGTPATGGRLGVATPLAAGSSSDETRTAARGDAKFDYLEATRAYVDSDASRALRDRYVEPPLLPPRMPSIMDNVTVSIGVSTTRPRGKSPIENAICKNTAFVAGLKSLTTAVAAVEADMRAGRDPSVNKQKAAEALVICKRNLQDADTPSGPHKGPLSGGQRVSLFQWWQRKPNGKIKYDPNPKFKGEKEIFLPDTAILVEEGKYSWQPNVTQLKQFLLREEQALEAVNKAQIAQELSKADLSAHIATAVSEGKRIVEQAPYVAAPEWRDIVAAASAPAPAVIDEKIEKQVEKEVDAYLAQNPSLSVAYSSAAAPSAKKEKTGQPSKKEEGFSISVEEVITAIGVALPVVMKAAELLMPPPPEPIISREVVHMHPSLLRSTARVSSDRVSRLTGEAPRFATPMLESSLQSPQSQGKALGHRYSRLTGGR